MPSGADLDVAVVERGQAVRHLGRRVVAVEHLEAQVGGAAAPAGDHVFGAVAQVGVEVERVRIVQPIFVYGPGGADEEGEIPLVGPGHLQ